MKVLLRPTGLTVQEEEYPVVEVDLQEFPEAGALDPIDVAAWLTEQFSLNTNETGQWVGQEGPLHALFERIRATPSLSRATSSKSLELALLEEEVK